MNGRGLVAMVVLVCVLACSASAAGPFGAADLSTGTYSLSVGTITIGADGAMTLSQTPLTLVKLGSNPNPPGPVPPGPDGLTERAKAIRDKALAVTGDTDRATTAKQLAALYSEISKKITDKQIGSQDMIAFAVKYGSDTLLLGKGANAKAAWQPTRDLLSDQWTVLLQKGATDAEYATLLNEAAAGLNASSPSKEAIDLAAIMQLIEMILKFISLLS